MSGHRPRRRFAQPFLVDRGAIGSIVDLVHPAEGDIVVEIGPGKGALTDALVARLQRLVVVEIDRDLAAMLRERHGVQQVLMIAVPPMHRFPALPQPLRGFLGARALSYNAALRGWCLDSWRCARRTPDSSETAFLRRGCSRRGSTLPSTAPALTRSGPSSGANIKCLRTRVGASSGSGA